LVFLDISTDQAMTMVISGGAGVPEKMTLARVSGGTVLYFFRLYREEVHESTRGNFRRCAGSGARVPDRASGPFPAADQRQPPLPRRPARPPVLHGGRLAAGDGRQPFARPSEVLHEEPRAIRRQRAVGEPALRQL